MIGAIDIGGTKIATALVDRAGRLLEYSLLPTSTDRPAQETLAAVAAVLRAFSQEVGRNLRGIGISCTGPVDPRSGTVGNVDLLPGWQGLNLADFFAKAFEVPVALENDANSAALAEAHDGAGKGARSLVYVTVSTGIGGALVLDGELYHGTGGSHPELGHHIIDPSGPLCYCGARGCWESLASGPAMVASAKANTRAGKPLPEDLTAVGICRCAESGESWAKATVDREAYYLGLGLANLITIFCPEKIVLGGGVMQSGHLFLDGARRVVRQCCGLVPTEKVSVSLSSLEPNAAVLGAARVWQARFEREIENVHGYTHH